MRKNNFFWILFHFKEKCVSGLMHNTFKYNKNCNLEFFRLPLGLYHQVFNSHTNMKILVKSFFCFNWALFLRNFFLRKKFMHFSVNPLRKVFILITGKVVKFHLKKSCFWFSFFADKFRFFADVLIQANIEISLILNVNKYFLFKIWECFTTFLRLKSSWLQINNFCSDWMKYWNFKKNRFSWKPLIFALDMTRDNNKIHSIRYEKYWCLSCMRIFQKCQEWKGILYAENTTFWWLKHARINLCIPTDYRLWINLDVLLTSVTIKYTKN